MESVAKALATVTETTCLGLGNPVRRDVMQVQPPLLDRFGHQLTQLGVPNDDHVSPVSVLQVLGQPRVSYGQVRRLCDDVVAEVTGMVLKEALFVSGAKELLHDHGTRVHTRTGPVTGGDALFVRLCTRQLSAEVDRAQGAWLDAQLPADHVGVPGRLQVPADEPDAESNPLTKHLVVPHE